MHLRVGLEKRNLFFFKKALGKCSPPEVLQEHSITYQTAQKDADGPPVFLRDGSFGQLTSD